jgi:hypothetical protein
MDWGVGGGQLEQEIFTVFGELYSADAVAVQQYRAIRILLIAPKIVPGCKYQLPAVERHLKHFSLPDSSGMTVLQVSPAQCVRFFQHELIIL